MASQDSSSLSHRDGCCWAFLSAGIQKRQGHSNDDESVASSGWQSLDSALKVFHQRTVAAMREAEVCALLSRCGAACGLVEAIVCGVKSHLPDVSVAAFVSKKSWPGIDSDELVTLVVRFSALPIVGEVATRSRLPFELLIEGDLSFAVQAPSQQSLDQDDALLLRASGLKVQPLADVLQLHKDLKAALGDGYRLSAAAYQWWLDNKEDRYPLQHSKFRRLYESLYGSNVASLMWSDVKRRAFWCYAGEETTYEYKVFALRSRGIRGAVTITAEVEYPPSDELQIEHRRRKHEYWLESMGDPKNRSIGDRICPSSVNFGKLMCDIDLGCEGADVHKITKLFSAAKWWGTGEEGWHQWDRTWLLTDKKDAFGGTLAAQGRIIWTLASNAQNAENLSQAQDNGRSHLFPPEYEDKIAPRTVRTQLILSACVSAVVLFYCLARYASESKLTH